jgi:hypothetical protein
MLIAFAPSTGLLDDRSPSRPDAKSTAPRDSRSPHASRPTSGRLSAKIAAVGWLALVAYYLVYAQPTSAGRIGPELTALVVLAGWAFVLAALAHHANGRSERLALQQRSRVLLDLLERSRSKSTARKRVPGEGGSTVR